MSSCCSLTLLYLLSIIRICLTSSRQYPLSSEGSPIHPSSDFGIFTHPAHPRHSLSIHQPPSSWCDPASKSYTGYLSVSLPASSTPSIATRHLFFYFFESRSSPTEDDLILWTNGGPGTSSALGLFMEHGPCRVVNGSETEVNPYSWNEKANVIYIDQPIGVGWSYADYGEEVYSSEEGGHDISAFMFLFFEAFPQFRGTPFHLAGESYAGRYLPVYAAQIYEDNKKLLYRSRGSAGTDVKAINLRSVIIGNGYTDFITSLSSYYAMACTRISLSPVADIADCVRMKTIIPHLIRGLTKSCRDTFDAMDCSAAYKLWDQEIEKKLTRYGKNPYDLRKDCDTTVPDPECYPIMNKIETYLNLPSTRSALGVPQDRPFTLRSVKLFLDFEENMDVARVKTEYYISQLLDRGVKMLLFAGTMDLLCNWVGNVEMVDGLEWSGSVGWKDAEWTDWGVSDDGKGRRQVWKSNEIGAETERKRAGRMKNWGNLTFVTVEDAGHMVPYDKPEEALLMLYGWLYPQL